MSERHEMIARVIKKLKDLNQVTNNHIIETLKGLIVCQLNFINRLLLQDYFSILSKVHRKLKHGLLKNREYLLSNRLSQSGLVGRVSYWGMLYTYLRFTMSPIRIKQGWPLKSGSSVEPFLYKVSSSNILMKK